MLKIISLIIINFVLVSNVQAEISDKEFAKCAVIQGELKRLDCFDSLAKIKKLNGPQKQSLKTNDVGKWDISVDINPIDDSKTVVLLLKADNKSGRSSVSLIARCKSNKTNVYINWNNYLGRNSNVLTRIGSNKAITQKWSLSTDSKATFHPSAVAFLKDLLKGNKLVTQITPYNESPVTAIFDTTNLINAIKPLKETCSW